MSFDASSTPPNNPDTQARLLNASCLDFLLIELVPMTERIAKDLASEYKLLDDEETNETSFFRLESLGYRVGQGLAERYEMPYVPRSPSDVGYLLFWMRSPWRSGN